ncbi:MAG: metallophosphoesterase family protein [Pseudomonadota bacterium]|nr:metallophosphoesterase family protein [Pseudomonadota bacterium]
MPKDVSYRAPDGAVIYALSDIHGRADLLAELLGRIDTDARGTGADDLRLVFLGDYVDRGPDSRGVIELLLSGLPDSFSVTCLMGNHERMLLDFLDGDDMEHWMSNGAEATVESYGIDAGDIHWAEGRAEDCRKEFTRLLPTAHRNFLDGLQHWHAAGGYHFVHAGVRPGVPLDQQDSHDMLWIRSPFLHSDKDLGRMVIHGHTPGDAPVVRKNRICIDTGAWFSGQLTALKMWRDERVFLATG